MANIGEINVGMSLDAEDFGSGLDRAGADVRTFGSDLDKVGRLAKGFLAGLSVYKAGGFLVGVANDAARAGELISGLDVVFGSFAGDLENFGRSVGGKFGVSLNTMLDAASQIGSVFQSTGIEDSVIAKYSKDIEMLALDYSRFKNTTMDDALEKMISGLSGEAEPLRKFGIFLSDVAVQAKAAELGFTAMSGKLTEGQKILARYALIMEQGSLGMGSAEREASGAAAKIEALSGAWQNLRISIGTMISGEVGDIFAEITKVFNATREFVDWADSKFHDRPGYALEAAGFDSRLDGKRSDVPPGVSDLLPDWSATALADPGGPMPSDAELRKMAAILNEQWNKHLADAAQAAFLDATPMKQALKMKPIFDADDWHAMLNPEKAKGKGFQGFSAAMTQGSSEWASTVLRSRFGGDRNPVADNTKRTADGVDKLIAGVSVMTGKLESLKTDPSPDWR